MPGCPPGVSSATPPPRRGLDSHPLYDAVEYHCPTCRAVIVVDAEQIGRVIRCCHCRCAGIVRRVSDGHGTDVMPALELYRAPA